MTDALGLGFVLSLKDQASYGLGKINQALMSTKTLSQEAIAQFASGAASFMSGVAVMGAGVLLLSKSVGGALGAAIKFESTMADVNKVANFTAAEYGDFSQSLIDMSKVIPMSAEGLGQIMAAAAQAGIAKKDLKQFVEDAAKMGVAFGISAQEAGDAMAGLRSIFALNQTAVVSLGDAVNHLANSMNATAPNLLNFLNRAGGIARQAGISADKVAAFGAAFIDLKTPPEIAARAFNSLAMKLTTASTAGDTAQKAFRGLGLSGAGIEKAFKEDATGAIMTFLGAVKNSSDPIGILKNILGEGFADDVAKLAGGFDRLQLAMELVGDKSNYTGSMLKEYEVRSKTVENALQLLSNRFDAVALRLGNVLLPVLGKLVNMFSSVVNWISDLPEPVYALAAAIASLSGVALTLVGALVMIGGAMKMWVIMRPLMSAGLLTLKAQFAGALATISAAAGPLLAVAAAGYVVYKAWNQNWGGIKDNFQAVSEGFSLAAKASIDGIVDVDAETAEKLKKAGIWDLSIEMGRVFYRIRKLWEGFKAGVTDVVNAVTSVINSFVDFLRPIGETIGNVLAPFKLFGEFGKTLSSSWEGSGKILGHVAASIGAIWLSVKLLSGTQVAFTAIGTAFSSMANLIVANPVGAAILGLIVVAWALYANWDKVCKFCSEKWEWFCGGVKTFLNDLEQYFAGEIEDIKKNWAGICDWCSEKFGGLRQWVSDCIDSITGFFTGWGDRISAAAGDLWAWLDDTALVQWAKGLPGRISSAVGNLFSGLFDFSSWGTELAGGLEPYMPSILAVLKKPFDDALNYIKGVPGRIVDFFKSLPSMIGDALSYMSFYVKKALAEAWNSLVDSSSLIPSWAKVEVPKPESMGGAATAAALSQPEKEAQSPPEIASGTLLPQSDTAQILADRPDARTAQAAEKTAATTGEAAGKSVEPVKVQSTVNGTVYVELDGDRVGKSVFNWYEDQAVRAGSGT